MSAFGSWRLSRERLFDGKELPTEKVERTGQGTLGGLQAFSEAKKRKCAKDCDCKKCEAEDRDFEQGGPGDDFALGYPMQADADASGEPLQEGVAGAPGAFAMEVEREHMVSESPKWEPWEPPKQSSTLDEFRKLSGMATSDAGYLPSPVSTGSRQVYSAHGLGMMDAGELEEMGPQDYIDTVLDIVDVGDRKELGRIVHGIPGAKKQIMKWVKRRDEKYAAAQIRAAINRGGQLSKATVAKAFHEGVELAEGKKLSRKAAERLVWKTTHKDYKGTKGKTVLVLRKGGTTAVALGDLTPDEINRKLPKGYMLEGKAEAAASRIAEEYFGEADPERVSGNSSPSRKDAIPKASPQFRKEVEAAIKKLKSKYSLPRETGWKPPKPPPAPTDPNADDDTDAPQSATAKDVPKGVDRDLL